MIPSWIYKSVVAKVETNVMEARVFFFFFFGGCGGAGQSVYYYVVTCDGS